MYKNNLQKAFFLDSPYSYMFLNKPGTWGRLRKGLRILMDRTTGLTGLTGLMGLKGLAGLMGFTVLTGLT